MTEPCKREVLYRIALRHLVRRTKNYHSRQKVGTPEDRFIHELRMIAIIALSKGRRMPR